MNFQISVVVIHFLNSKSFFGFFFLIINLFFAIVGNLGIFCPFRFIHFVLDTCLFFKPILVDFVLSGLSVLRSRNQNVRC